MRNSNSSLSPLRARKRKLFLIRLCIILFILIILTLGLAIFSGQERMKIREVTVSGNAAVTSDQVLTIVNRDLTGRYAHLFAKSNFLIFPRFKIEEDLLYEIKTIKEAELSWNGWQKLSVEITERKPHSVWCGNDSKQAGGDCYFVDRDGFIYDQAPTFSGTMFIKNYSDISGEIVGQYFLPKQIYYQIFTLINLLEQKNIKVVTVFFDGTDYRFGLENGPDIIFNDKNKFEQSFQNLFSALDNGSLDLKKEATSIKYIDLRFDNKIVIGRREK